eukprot:CAMPEP_0185199352 /NCGR_PEP_ID=MMETSP1140-20130426/44901_1 /TAXON_ID=298111 /ORGANISM="Pavlova sp., Strain CCMP459" /LENGTH=113 /DNA_ID=CAMNT_0027766619 /DNA_START=152 /DNA_END=490 /DNA_ORIENTATION=-
MTDGPCRQPVPVSCHPANIFGHCPWSFCETGPRCPCRRWALTRAWIASTSTAALIPHSTWWGGTCSSLRAPQLDCSAYVLPVHLPPPRFQKACPAARGASRAKWTYPRRRQTF